MIYKTVYEMTDARNVVRKQRFIDDFEAERKEWWREIDVTGTGSTGQATAQANVGWQIFTASTAGQSGAITFNDFRPFENGKCSLISVVRRQTSNAMVKVGLGETSALGLNHSANDAVMYSARDAFGSFPALVCVGPGGSTSTFMTVPHDTNRHSIKLDMNTANVTIKELGVLEATHSTTCPVNALQPMFQVENETSTTVQGRIAYIEVWNR